VLRAIISQETGGKVIQFRMDGTPYWSEDGKGGVGLMQLTVDLNNPNYPSEIWNWKKDINDGVALFNAKFYKAQALAQKAWQDAVRQVGAGNIAPWTPNMIVEDAIRGWDGYDSKKNPLLEFRLFVDPTGKASWQRTPTSLRYYTDPTTGERKPLGDPNYVLNVLGWLSDPGSLF
jgi:hypothetical protein